MNKSLLLLAAALLVVGAGSMVGAGTQAIFTDSATSTGNSFTAGTVDLQLQDVDETSTTTVAASISDTLMAPGDPATMGWIEVTNTGTLAIRYAISTTDTTAAGANNVAMSAALTVDVDTRAATTVCTAAQGGAGQAAVVTAGTLQTLAIGSSAAGQDAAPNGGDRVLAASGAERLCFYVSLPSGTGSAAQGGVASYTFTFDGEQTANNP